jgi:hypothetical protein
VRATLRGRIAAGVLAALLAAGPGIALPAAAQAAGGSAKSGSGAAKGKGGGAVSGGGAASGAGAASGGGAAGNPLGGGGLTVPGGATPVPTQTVPPVVVNTTAGAGSGGGISSTTAIGIAVAAFVIIAVILFAVMRDARSRLPKAHGPSEERIPGSKRPPKARKLSAAERKRRKRGRAPRRR